MVSLYIGTSAFTAAGWPGPFYPGGLPEREYLTYYAARTCRTLNPVQIQSAERRGNPRKDRHGIALSTVRFRRPCGVTHSVNDLITVSLPQSSFHRAFRVFGKPHHDCEAITTSASIELWYECAEIESAPRRWHECRRNLVRRK